MKDNRIILAIKKAGLNFLINLNVFMHKHKEAIAILFAIYCFITLKISSSVGSGYKKLISSESTSSGLKKVFEEHITKEIFDTKPFSSVSDIVMRIIIAWLAYRFMKWLLNRRYK